MSIHKSAMGRAVDMSSLTSQHEKVRAVGNMNVNARGDVIDSHGRVIKDSTQRVKSTYSNNIDNSAAHLTPGVHAVHEVKMGSAIVEDTTEPVELSTSEKELFDELDSEEEVKK